MNVFKYVATLFFSISTTAAVADVCRGISSDLFKSVELKVHSIQDSNFLEEGLSFEEYPDFDIDKIGNNYQVMIGAGSFGDDDEQFKLECEYSAFALNLYVSEKVALVIKDFQYENDEVVAASVYQIRKGQLNLVATFTKKGLPVVYGSLGYFRPASPDYFLSTYINDENSSIYVRVQVDGSYHIEIGSIEVDTYAGNEGSAAAVYDPDQKILYVEIPKMNLIVELHVKTESWSEFTRVKVKAGSLDSAAPLKEVGEFMDYIDINSEE